MNDKMVLIYDEKCPLCKRFKQALQMIDSGNDIQFVDANMESTYQEFPILKMDECLSVVHIIKTNAEVITGPDVITELVAHYPGVSKFAWLLETDMGKKVNKYFYKKLDQLRKKAILGCSRC